MENEPNKPIEGKLDELQIEHPIEGESAGDTFAGGCLAMAIGLALIILSVGGCCYFVAKGVRPADKCPCVEKGAR